MIRAARLATALTLAATAAAAQTDIDRSSDSAFVQDGMGVSGATSGSTSASQNDMRNDAQSISGGNVFDFSSSGRRIQPPPPGLPSFGGGPCIGPGYGGAAALAGISFGVGASTIDEACTRRNWIQTIIGASQHMAPDDSALLKRLAFEVMRDDPMLAPAMERIGVPPVEKRPNALVAAFTGTSRSNGNWQTGSAPEAGNGMTANPLPPDTSIPSGAPAATPSPAAAAEARPQPEPERLAVASNTCNIVLSRDAPASFGEVLGSRGCEVVRR